MKSNNAAMPEAKTIFCLMRFLQALDELSIAKRGMEVSGLNFSDRIN